LVGAATVLVRAPAVPVASLPELLPQAPSSATVAVAMTNRPARPIDLKIKAT
jgi:hypothetical protein